MNFWSKKLYSRAILATIAATFMAGSSVYSATNNQLVSEPLTKAKLLEPISVQSRQFLQSRDSESATVWLFFTDKGLFDQNEFEAVSKSMKLSDKASKRRAKVGLDRILFVDLPIVQNYVDQIIELGATHRKNSRWLNAASFEIRYSDLDKIAALPFVAEIRPVAKTTRSDQIAIDPIEPANDPTEEVSTLEYGASASQLLQIGVDVAHDQGLSGNGVTLAIFDTGYRKSHEVFAKHYLDGRVLAEHDFIFNDGNTANEPIDVSGQWDHGTMVWSITGGYKFGQQVGPAYRATFILCKTEDLRSETPVEEDNWVAAAEWVDSLGADVITSSLNYFDWYTYSSFDGQTATISIAANVATDLGIIVCNSAANNGPGLGTIGAPADAFDILSCGAVNSSDGIASFSSRGPTFDGRIKPELCARGVSNSLAQSSSDISYGTGNGTSFAAPLVAGAVCLMIEAKPNFPPDLIRTALKETASNSTTPDNTYGWGIVDLAGALSWGSNFSADQTFGDAPMIVQFSDLSNLSPSSWDWAFGDGATSTLQNPTHQYSQPGAYDVSLTIGTTYGPINTIKSSFIIAKADTVIFVSDSAYAGNQVMMSVLLRNSMDMSRVIIPFIYNETPELVFDSASFGERTTYFERLRMLTINPNGNSYTVELTADNGGGSPPLAPGFGEICKLFFSIDDYELGGLVNPIDSSTNSNYKLRLETTVVNFIPDFVGGTVTSRFVIRGDANGSGALNIADLTHMVTYLYRLGEKPVSIQAGDSDGDGDITINDLTYMIDYMFRGGLSPPTP